MQKVIHRIRLDLERPSTQAAAYMRRGDTLSREIVISVYEQGKPYCVENGVTARIRGKKSGGAILFNECRIADNCVVVDVTTQMLTSVGEVDCELNLYGADGALLTTPRFSIFVEDVLIADGQLESQDEFTALTTATEEMRVLYDTVDEAYKSGAFKGEKGEDGAQGEQGARGSDGVSPSIAITDIPNGHRVTITDADGEKSFDVLDGNAESDKLWKPTVTASGVISWEKTTSEDAPTSQNIKGAQGEQGKQGADGVSPSVSVTQIDGGHRVTITDADGTHVFNVSDGKQGAQGEQGATGATGATGAAGADGATFTPSVSESGDLSWTNNGGLPNPETVNIKGPKGDGAAITVDTSLDMESTNPVQNKVVTSAFDGKADVVHSHLSSQIETQLLWSGVFESGSITVPDYHKYRLFAFVPTIPNSEGEWVLQDGLYAIGSYWCGIGGYTLWKSLYTIVISYRFTVSGDVVTIDDLNKGITQWNPTTGTVEQFAIGQIYGILQ